MEDARHVGRVEYRDDTIRFVGLLMDTEYFQPRIGSAFVMQMMPAHGGSASVFEEHSKGQFSFFDHFRKQPGANRFSSGRFQVGGHFHYFQNLTQKMAARFYFGVSWHGLPQDQMLLLNHMFIIPQLHRVKSRSEKEAVTDTKRHAVHFQRI